MEARKAMTKFILTGFLFALLLAQIPLASAQSGNSLPYFAGSALHIPRIDVEGFGSLQLTLTLKDANALTFAIATAVPANTAMSPGATFNLATAVLTIPTLKVGAEFYSAQLQLKSGDIFHLTAANGTKILGQDAYNAQCASCHGTNGTGGSVNVSMVNCANCSTLSQLTTYIKNVTPLTSPASCVGTCASDIASYITTVFSTISTPMVAQKVESIMLLPLDATLRKAALQLVGRLPTDAENAQVNTSGETGLRTVLDNMMLEEAFYDRVSEIFNDFLLTDRYLAKNGPAEQALQLMPRSPSVRWFDPGVGNRPPNYQQLRLTTNDSVAREPLELINYVVRNKLPMTETLTADYFMVNGYSAKSYDVFDDLKFKDEWDANEWLPARLTGIPHAGLLTSLMFLNRYPTSDTNVNRGRSRVVYDLFLDVDILALDGARPDGTAVDISSPAPTMQNMDRVICHGLLDPVASSFQNWDGRGRYRPNTPWYEDMFQAGFAGVSRPDSQKNTSLTWLSGQMKNDPRFHDAMVRIMYYGFTGQEPLEPPGESATEAEADAYAAESSGLDDLRDIYVADNQNLKTLVKEIMLSPYVRADGIESDAFAIVHEATGAARILTPELMHRKINALLGFEWRGPLDSYSTTRNLETSAKLIDSRQFYNSVYGGIDSFAITERLTESNGLMVYVQERMANELACYAVPNDFLNAASKRLMFPFVETSTLPTTSQNQAAIKANIQHLHSHLLGEELALTDPEIETSYALFTSVLSTGQKNVGSTETSLLPRLCQRNRDLTTGAILQTKMTNDSNYVMRAWMAVAAYLMADYSFLYE